MEAMTALIRSAVDPIIQIDEAGIIQLVNQACLNTFIYEEEELIGQNVKMLMPEEHASKHDGYLHKYKVTGEKRVLGKGRKLQGLKSNGSLFPMFLSLSEAKIEGKTVFTGIIHDTSEADQERDRLLAILTSAVDPIAQIDKKGIIRMVNPACCKVFKYQESELLGQNVNILMPEPYKKLHDSYLENYVRTGVKKVMGIGRKVRGQRSDGSTFSLFLTLSEARVNNEILFTGIMRDLSVEEEEREALELIIASAVDPIVVIDSVGIMEQVNPACTSVFGYSMDEMLGRNITMLMPQKHAINHGRYLERYFERKGNNYTSSIVGHGRDVEAKRKDGSSIPIFLSVSECVLASRDRTVFIGIMRNMTEKHKAIEAEVERQKSEALLLNMLPESISNRLKSIENHENIADFFESVTILFVDVVGFTQYSSTRSPVEIVNFLNMLFQGLDRLVDKYGLEKIKTIGDAYMVVSGLKMEEDHTLAMLEFSLDVLRFVQEVNIADSFVSHGLGVRIGIGTGSVVAGVVGSKKRFFDLWGDAVNTSSRMESTGIENCIQCTEDVALVARQYPDKFAVVDRGCIDVKGKGEMEVFLIGDKESESFIRKRLHRHSRLKRRESAIMYEKMIEEFNPSNYRRKVLWLAVSFSAGFLVGRLAFRRHK